MVRRQEEGGGVRCQAEQDRPCSFMHPPLAAVAMPPARQHGTLFHCCPGRELLPGTWGVYLIFFCGYPALPGFLQPLGVLFVIQAVSVRCEGLGPVGMWRGHCLIPTHTPLPSSLHSAHFCFSSFLG